MRDTDRHLCASISHIDDSNRCLLISIIGRILNLVICRKYFSLLNNI